MAEIYRTCLVALSDSEPISAILLQHTRALASRFDSRVVVVQALEGAVPAAAGGAKPDAVERQHAARLTFARFATQLRLAGVWSPDSIVVNGRLGQAVVNAAKVEHADLILIAGDRESEPSDAGESADYVLRHAPCPVLVCAHGA